jgi:hypothetical protein
MHGVKIAVILLLLLLIFTRDFRAQVKYLPDHIGKARESSFCDRFHQHNGRITWSQRAGNDNVTTLDDGRTPLWFYRVDFCFHPLTLADPHLRLPKARF